MPPKMSGFRLSGQPLPLAPVSPAIKRTIEFLDKLKDDELLTTIDVAKSLGYSVGGFKARANHVELKSYRAKIRYPTVCLVWGNTQTISRLSTHKELVCGC